MTFTQVIAGILHSASIDSFSFKQLNEMGMDARAELGRCQSELCVVALYPNYPEDFNE